MGNWTAKRSILRGATGAALIILALLLPVAALADLSGDEDSYAYPLLGTFSRTDSGSRFAVKEKGENYGAGVFFRMPISTRMVGSPNVEAATESDRRFIANVRAEINFIRADLTASADNAASFDNTTYKEINSAAATGEAKYRLFHCESDIGYRIKTGYSGSFEPFLGLGLLYAWVIGAAFRD